jgi:hypothetical protein
VVKEKLGVINPLGGKLDGQLMHRVQLGVEGLYGRGSPVFRQFLVPGVDGPQVSGAQQEAHDEATDQRHRGADKYVLPENTAGLFKFQKGSTILVEN